jgi:hypothetical protein
MLAGGLAVTFAPKFGLDLNKNESADDRTKRRLGRLQKAVKAWDSVQQDIQRYKPSMAF